MKRLCLKEVQVSVSHLLEDLAVRLELILLTEHLSGAQTVSLWKSPRSVFKHFVQGVHPGVQPCHQLVLIVDSPVRTCWVTANWACLDPTSPFQVAACSREEVPRYEGDDRVDPDNGAEDLQQQGVHILLQLHLGGWSQSWGLNQKRDDTLHSWSIFDLLLRLKVAGEGFLCVAGPATQRHNMKF